MLVDLRSLKPNPMRDFVVDPIDEGRVEKLTESIKDHGFWGGVVCRQLADGTIQIAAGHHRVAAAINAGIQSADLFVGAMDDDAMARIHGSENAMHGHAANREERKRLEEEDVRLRAEGIIKELTRYARLLTGEGRELLRLRQHWPKGEVFPFTHSFRSEARRATEVLEELNRILADDDDLLGNDELLDADG